MNTRILAIGGGAILITALIVFLLFSFLSQAPEGEGGDTPNGGGFFDFLNFGSEAAKTTDNTGNDEPETTPDDPSLSKNKLRILVEAPVSAAIATTTKNGVSARYIERATGYINDVRIDSAEIIKVSNVTTPGIQEAFFLPGAEEFVIRYFDETLENAETYGARLVRAAATSSSLQASDGAFFNGNLIAIAPSPNSNLVGYIEKGATGSTVYTSRSNNTARTTVLNSPVTEWKLQWPKADTLALTTSPSGTTSGYLYFVSSKGGALQKILGGILGLTTLVSPSGEKVLYSSSNGTGFGTYVYTIETKTAKSLQVATLPEKCVWSKREKNVLFCGVPTNFPRAALFPDVWYQGLGSFNDDIWKFDVESETSTLLAKPSTVSERGVDLIDPSLSKDESTLLFINKKDGSLWALDLTNQ